MEYRVKYIGLLITSLALLAGGCQKIQRLKTPRSEVVGLRLTEQTEAGVRLEMLLAIHNPNDVSLPLKQAQYTVTLEQMGTFTFNKAANLTLPAEGMQTLMFAAAFATDGQDISGFAWQAYGSVAYELPGEIRDLLTEYGVPLPTTNFRASGWLQ